MNAIVIVDLDNGIAKEGKQPIFIPDDLRRFKELTTGHPVFMGWKTAMAIGKPLPGRDNYIVSTHPGEIVPPEGFRLIDLGNFKSRSKAKKRKQIDMVLEGIAECEPDGFVIGGAATYELFMPYVDTIYGTVVHEHLGCDQFFPKLDDSEWTPRFDDGMYPRHQHVDKDGNQHVFAFFEQHRRIARPPSEQPVTHLPDVEEFLATVELEYNLWIHLAEKGTKGDATLWLAMELSQLCLNIGMFAVADRPMSTEEERADRVHDCMTVAQAYWVRATAFLKGISEIEYHPMHMVAIILKMSEGTDPASAEFHGHVEAFGTELLDKLEEEQRRELREVEVVEVPEIRDFGGDPKELLRAYFFYIDKLGVFHRDRNDYKTDEERAIHDKLVAIGRKLGVIKL